ncbi:MAG: 2-oxo acid dehydrogenase subunit E2 [Planctomycetota bacterium]|nr:2-oxo acid dehydrogenase subunit E2 [Planctomycetota bacterium]MDA1179233.1 2-oxo acid dehydrogenase subunit E2 [Planctomycetota bacterium]
MTIEVKLPSLGEGVESGDVVDIKVSEGDVITKNQGILDLETDKATVEVPSAHAGKVVKVHVAKGQTISVGAVLLSLEGSTAPATPNQPGPKKPAAVANAPTPSTPAAKTEPVAPAPPAPPIVPATTVGQAKTEFPSSASSRAVAPVVVASDSSSTYSEVPAAGPAVRRFAREAGIDLTRVSGSGSGGRITRDDVLDAVRSGGITPATPPSPVKTREQQVTTVVTESVADPNDGSGADKWGPVRIEPMSRVRQTIAAKMHQSWSTVPRVTNFDDADVTELERLRQASKKDYEKSGIKLTSLPFVIKAAAMALQNHPLLNASIDLERQQIVFKKYFNIGIAVDTDRGLVVPALRAANEKSVAEIARDLGVMAEQSRENQFSLEDLRGGTFTISNLGAIGGTYSTPIVNVPEVAILLIGRARKMPVVLQDEIQIRLMMPLSLSYDHRLVDGGAAARFLNEVIEYLAAPGRLLLAP